MQRLARLAAGRSGAASSVCRRAALSTRSGPQLGRRRSSSSEYDAYLAKFGDRTVNELKLESATLHDDPLPLFRAVGALARQCRGRRASRPRTIRSRPPIDCGSESRRRVARRAGLRIPLRRLVFGWVLRHAQRRVRDRENLRLERTRLFGRVRRIFLELGRRLHAARSCSTTRATSSTSRWTRCWRSSTAARRHVDLRALAALRKREFARVRRQAPAPGRSLRDARARLPGHDFRRAGGTARGFRRRA